MSSFLFYALAAIVVGAALAMVLSRNLVHSALYMAAAFLGMAFVYLLLQAEYVAVVQILVYVGAISVLFVFGIMLTKRERMEDTNRFNRYGPAVVLALFALLARAIAVSSFALAAPPAAISAAAATVAATNVAAPNIAATNVAATNVAGDAVSISDLLTGELALPLEATGLLLLAALVGAIVIGKGRSAAK